MVQRYREGASLGLSLVAVGFLGALVALSALQIPHMTIFVDLLPAFVLGCIVFAPNSPLGRLLESAPLRFIGRLSYSLYAKMVQADPFRMSARLLLDFAEYKCFEQLTKQVALLMEFGGAAAKETASQAGIAKVEFWAFDKSLYAIAEPRRQEFDKE